uniref:Uncharacterized protein n=1 Tax=Sinocyclocheilus rhinocerous TaxID=307959 RepID=A0A673GEZ0_9TELE
MSLKVSLVTGPARVDPDGQTSLLLCVQQRRPKWASRPLRCTASGCRKKTSLGPLSFYSKSCS